MRFSRTYVNTVKASTRDFDSVSHAMLVQGGFVDQVASGIFTFLPPGNRVLRKIENIVRQEMNAIDAEEVSMPTLHPKNLWEKTKRWDSVDVLYKLQSKHGPEYALDASAEEVVTPLAKKYISSYKDLPFALYQITRKFRDEARAKSGLLRGREFKMKDLYSFHADQDDLNKYYDRVTEAYLKIFSRCGLDDVKITEASGGDFSDKHSHEFNVITPAGEVDLVYCSDCTFAQNIEVVKKDISQCPKCDSSAIKTDRAIEIGNIFDLGIRYSKLFDLKYIDEEGKKQLVVMGCYGIGTSRLVGAVAEVNNDEYGIIWPREITPFHAHLINLNQDDPSYANLVYRTLSSEGYDILYDDRTSISPGEKFVVSDLVGCPVRLVVSKKTQRNVEWKERVDSKFTLLNPTNVIEKLGEYYS